MNVKLCKRVSKCKMSDSKAGCRRAQNHPNSFRNTIRVSISLDPDQDRLNVGPDLGPNCLPGISADDKSHELKTFSHRSIGLYLFMTKWFHPFRKSFYFMV